MLSTKTLVVLARRGDQMAAVRRERKLPVPKNDAPEGQAGVGKNCAEEQRQSEACQKQAVSNSDRAERVIQRELQEHRAIVSTPCVAARTCMRRKS